MIVGLNGYAQSGKDTVGDYLARHYGFKKVAFADKLRELTLAIDPYVLWGTTWLRYSEALDLIGYERAKKETNAREMLVNIGDGVRNVLGPDTWASGAFMGLDNDTNYVFTDVRYPNEFSAVQANGRFGLGEVWRIERPGVGPALDAEGVPFVSETLLDGWDFDFVLANDQTVWDLERQVDGLMKALDFVRPAALGVGQ